MKISEMIIMMTKALKEHGDLECHAYGSKNQISRPVKNPIIAPHFDLRKRLNSEKMFILDYYEEAYENIRSN